TGVLGALDESIPVDQLRTLPEAVEALERRMILASLRRARGNKTRAASALGISRRNLIRKVQAYGLEALLEDSEGQGS
ncbi:MAG: helix-turn-helix domain-containing protein, partial [Polyangiales bacterium]